MRHSGEWALRVDNREVDAMNEGSFVGGSGVTTCTGDCVGETWVRGRAAGSCDGGGGGVSGMRKENDADGVGAGVNCGGESGMFVGGTDLKSGAARVEYESGDSKWFEGSCDGN